MKKNTTYKKLNSYHKVRYRFFSAIKHLGINGFPSEYWEPPGGHSEELMRKLGYKLTKKGWVKK